MTRGTTTPAALLDVAMGLVESEGLTGITIDAVAKAAGVSKGAVLHHFKTKSDLLAALVQRFAATLASGVEARLAKDRRPGALVRAMLALGRPRRGSAGLSDVDRFRQAVLAAAVHDNSLLAPMREVGGRLRERVLADEERGLSDLLIVLARDGMLLWQMCGFLDPAEPLARQLRRELERRAEVGKDEPDEGERG